ASAWSSPRDGGARSMPHVRRSVLIPIDAPVQAVSNAVAAEVGTDRFPAPFTAVPFENTTVSADVTATEAGRSALRLDSRGAAHVPCFGWSAQLQAWVAARAELAGLAERVDARAHGEPAPPPPRRLAIVPPVPFSAEQARRLATLSVAALFASFSG